VEASSRTWLPSLAAVAVLAFVALGATAPGEHLPSPNAAATSAAPSFADPANPLVLVNKQHPLPPDYVPADLYTPDVRSVAPEGSTLLVSAAATAAQEMFTEAEHDGTVLTLASGYRSYETQARVHDNLIASLGAAAASEASAPPGHSEHQTGLAFDIGDGSGECSFEPCFADQPAAIWVRANAHRFGFIIRYPEGSEQITGYGYEPWHLRFVGVEAATEIHDRGLTLEDYIDATG
jgi:D-alanyl-D-alanine carboxypeptidase